MSLSSLEKKIELTGITGGIATGKSRAAYFLSRRFGILYFSADKLAHSLLEPDKEGWRLVKEIDTEFLNQDETINKSFFRQALFQDQELRDKVEKGIHPLVWDLLVKKITSQSFSSERKSVLVEVPLLFEAGWQDRFKEVIVVYSKKERCLDRLKKRDQISTTQAEKELAVQWPLPKKCLLADHVIDNSGSWSRTLLELLHLGEILWAGDTKEKMV